MGPISSPDGEEYLHREDVLDKLISTFIKYIEDAEPDPGKMNMSELKQYTAACMEQLDEDTLRNVAYNLKNTLKYSSNA